MKAIICNDLTVEGDMTVKGKLTLRGDIVPQSGMDVTGGLNSSAGLCTSLFAINALGGVLCKEGCRVVGGYRISKPAQNNTWSINWVKNNDGSRKLVFIIDQTPIFHVQTVDTKIPLNLNWDYTEGLNIFAATVASIGAVACVAAVGVKCFGAPGGDPQRAKVTRTYVPHIDAEGEVTDIELAPVGPLYEEGAVGEPDNVIRPDRGMAERENGEDKNGDATILIPENCVPDTQELKQSQNSAALCIELAEFKNLQSASVLGTELPRVATPELIAVVEDLVSDGQPILQSFMLSPAGLEPIEITELDAAGGLEPNSPHYRPQTPELQGTSLNFYDSDDEKIDTYSRASQRAVSIQALSDYVAQDHSSPYASSSALHDAINPDPSAFDAGLMPNTPVIQLEPDMAIEMSSTANQMNHVQVTQITETVVRAQSEALLITVNEIPEAARAEVLNAGKADISRGAETLRQNLIKENHQATISYDKVCEARNRQRTIDEQAMSADHTTRYRELHDRQLAQQAVRSQAFLDSLSMPRRGARVMPELPPLVRKPWINPKP